MSERYYVRIEQDDLVFSAGHFITFDQGTCERLHGHNFRVAAEVEGPLDENQFVVDFLVLRDTLRAIIGELDHRMLLPTEHPEIRVELDELEIIVRFERRRWVFPREECHLLPVSNTSSELLARHIGGRLLDDLHAQTGSKPAVIRIEVEESFGQSAICELHAEQKS